jgi:hypothetical protein
MRAPDWMSRRHRALHMTLRDIDCAEFDVAETIATFQRWNVTLFSFFAGGYVTTYPSKLPWQKVSRHLAPGRDLCGEIIVAAHRAGMIAIPMIDLGELPLDLALEHPEWAAQHADGSPYLKTDGIAISCPLGHYRRGLARELVAELLERYGKDLDGLKWGGASYGFPPGIDHNPIAVEAYQSATGHELPETANDPDYAAWRVRTMAGTVAHLRDVVHQTAGVPVVGNSVWHLGGDMLLEELAHGQDLTQVEVQTRTHATPDGGDVCWERFSAPIETTRHTSACCESPPWVVASYFLAWPWRRVAVPYAEQKLYVAQIAANGATPMVNLTCGSPAHHEDPRGFRAIEELYGFMARHDAWYQDDHSAARIAVVYDHPSANAARAAGDLYRNYLDELHACEDTLDRWHLPYDLISSRMLEEGRGEMYHALVIPGPGHAAEATLDCLRALKEKGVGLVVTGPVHEGSGLEFLGLKSVFQPQPFHVGRQMGMMQAYARFSKHRRDDLLNPNEPLLAVSGHWQSVLETSGSDIPLRRAEPFRVFPEGISYPDRSDPGEPLAVFEDSATSARSVCFPFSLGRTIRRTGHPDAEHLLVNAISWVTRDKVLPLCDRFRDVRMSLRESNQGLAVHLINTTGRSRYLTEFTAVRELDLRIPTGFVPTNVTQASSGLSLPFSHDGVRLHTLFPELIDYDLILIHR